MNSAKPLIGRVLGVSQGKIGPSVTVDAVPDITSLLWVDEGNLEISLSEGSELSLRSGECVLLRANSWTRLEARSTYASYGQIDIAPEWIMPESD